MEHPGDHGRLGQVLGEGASFSRFICQEIGSGFAVVAWSGNGRAFFQIKTTRNAEKPSGRPWSQPKPMEAV